MNKAKRVSSIGQGSDDTEKSFERVQRQLEAAQRQGMHPMFVIAALANAYQARMSDIAHVVEYMRKMEQTALNSNVPSVASVPSHPSKRSVHY